MYYANHMGRPATGQTKVRSVRVGSAWDTAKANAEQDGETISDVVTRLLNRYNAAQERKRQRDQEP